MAVPRGVYLGDIPQQFCGFWGRYYSDIWGVINLGYIGCKNSPLRGGHACVLPERRCQVRPSDVASNRHDFILLFEKQLN